MFTKNLVAFLRDLERHNDRDWFQANKGRYEADVREPALEFIRAMAPRLRKLSKHLVADDKKVGGSLMRIHRDVRFGKDKRPFNTHVSMIFHHSAGRKAAAPGFYVRITTEEIQIGTGLWQPDTASANLIRERIASRSKEWVAARDDPAFRKVWQGLDGESLKRPPRGFDPTHPLVEDLKRKDFVSFTELKPSSLARKDFPDRVAERYQASTKLMRFLSKALDLPY